MSFMSFMLEVSLRGASLLLLIPKKVEAVDVGGFAHMFGCRVLFLPMKYLSLMLGCFV
jgi:hypothetical protein